MKVIGIEDNEVAEKKLNKKKITIAIIVGIIIVLSVILFTIYSLNKNFRDVVDKYVLMKNVIEDSTASISIDENETNYVYAYDKYITVLTKNTLSNYNSSGKLDSELTVEISSPIMATGGKYLLIAEKSKSKIYLISGSEKIWEKDLEGNITQISVNKNGYVAVILSGTTYKSVIQTFDAAGNELFKTYLSSTIALDVDISMDNLYLAFAEVNTSGTAIQSTIKLVSIQITKTNPTEAITYTYTANSGSMITDIKYQEGNRLVCMYDDSIHVIKNEEDEEILKFNEEDTKVSFADIKMSSHVYRIIEKSSLLNTQTSLEIVNSSSKKTSTYTLNGTTKEVCSYEGTVAINLGSEVHFIGTNGWLLKRYISNQEINKIVICSNFAGIVYRNKIEIVNL